MIDTQDGRGVVRAGWMGWGEAAATSHAPVEHGDSAGGHVARQQEHVAGVEVTVTQREGHLRSVTVQMR